MKKQVEIYEGLEGYTKPLTKRIEVGKEVKQIINGEVVAKFHKKTDDLVNKIISQRVEKGIYFKNLIREEDRHLTIELSNPEKLKETRILPKGFKTSSMIAVFGDNVSITNLEDENNFGVVISDKNVAETFNSLFDALWKISEPA